MGNEDFIELIHMDWFPQPEGEFAFYVLGSEIVLIKNIQSTGVISTLMMAPFH